MGKHTKDTMDIYKESMKNNYDDIAAAVPDDLLMMGLLSIRDRTEAALVTSVAGVEVDRRISNPGWKVHDGVGGYIEVQSLKARLDAIDSIIEEVKERIDATKEIQDIKEMPKDLTGWEDLEEKAAESNE
jgi:hypothetical protein